MLTKENLLLTVLVAVQKTGVEIPQGQGEKITISYPEPAFGDYSTNAALILSKPAKMNPQELAKKIIENISLDYFDRVEIAGPGFINFFIKTDFLIAETGIVAEQGLIPQKPKSEKILVEYFQPNIAKPLHIGHLQNAIIGDTVKRCLIYLGYQVESETHMGDWGTQFGLLIMAYKLSDKKDEIALDPIPRLNALYVEINKEIENDKSLYEKAKLEFVKLEQGDEENRRIWKMFVDWSMEKFLRINDLMDILPFDHHWPESFYEDKMPVVLEKLKQKKLLVESKGAQIVNLEELGLGVAVIVKSDGGTIYALRDLATFIYRKSLGYKKQIYVVDNRQSHAFRQLFKMLELMGESDPGEAIHVDYGFTSFKGSVLSSRKGNMILAEDVISQANDKVAKIIQEKNPDLKDKQSTISAVTKGALKYFILSHNRHSDIEFDWDEALNFDGNTGPYLQYVHARLSSILRKEKPEGKLGDVELTATERQIMLELTKFTDIVEESMRDYMPNSLTNYLFELAGLINKFYHESPVLKESDPNKKLFRLVLISACKQILAKGLDLLGIRALEEM
jgi:arginyl-tRNA synthetase